MWGYFSSAVEGRCMEQVPLSDTTSTSVPGCTFFKYILLSTWIVWFCLSILYMATCMIYLFVLGEGPILCGFLPFSSSLKSRFKEEAPCPPRQYELFKYNWLHLTGLLRSCDKGMWRSRIFYRWLWHTDLMHCTGISTSTNWPFIVNSSAPRT